MEERERMERTERGETGERGMGAEGRRAMLNAGMVGWGLGEGSLWRWVPPPSKKSPGEILKSINIMHNIFLNIYLQSGIYSRVN